jgi:hypothetical protein
MQFVSFNLIIKHRFDVLNKHLLLVFGITSERELEQTLLDNICRTSTNEYKDLSHYRNTHFQTRFDTYCGEYCDLERKNVWKESKIVEREYCRSTNPESEDGIQQLRIHHNEICNIARLVISTYGVFIILELLNVTADIITVLYFTTDFVISEIYVSAETIGWCSIWLLLHAAKLISVTKSCQLFTTSGNHTSVLLGKLILLSRPIRSSTMNQLQMFSHQLLHTRLRASACDFFDLDNTILGSVAKVAVSYAIVLLLNQKT